MRKVFARLGLLASLMLPVMGIGASGITTAHAAGGDHVTIRGHATLELPGTSTTPCDLAEGAAPPGQLCDYVVDAGATCKGVSDDENGAANCTVAANGSITSQTACGTGKITVNFTVTEADGDTVNGNWAGITFVSGQAPIVNQPTNDGAANGNISVAPTGAAPPTTCATGFDFVAEVSVPS